MTLVHILFCFARLIIDSWGLEKSVDFSSGNFLYRNPHRFFFGSEAFQIKRCSKTTPLYLFVYFRKMCFNEEKNVSLFFLKCRFWNVAPFFFLHFQWFIHKVSSFWQITSYIYKPILESSAKIYHISSSNTTYFFWQTFFYITTILSLNYFIFNLVSF